MEKKMETIILGLYWGLYRDNGKENGNYRDYRGYIGIIRDYFGVISGYWKREWKLP